MDEGGLMSHGAIVKEDGRVLHELAANLKKPSNVSCRIEKFGNVVDGFCEVKRRWVCEMGFEGLLYLSGCRLPRSLCYWLATRVDCKKKELVLDDCVKCPLSKVQVHWVYGLPYGPKPVPNKVKGPRMEAVEKEIWDYYGSITAGGTKCINGQAIIDAVDKPADDEKFFKRAFLMLALNEVLCPTTCYRLSIKLVPAVTVSSRAKEYDWCSLVLDHLLFYLARFSKQFESKGYVAGCGGCTHFMAVLYLDKLNRSPVCWGVFPRVKVWHSKEVNKAIAEDKIPNGDFGRLGCIDLAYGEHHPKDARDLYPNAAVSIEDRVAHKFYIVNRREYRKKKRNKATNGNPYTRKMNKRKRDLTGQDYYVLGKGEEHEAAQIPLDARLHGGEGEDLLSEEDPISSPRTLITAGRGSHEFRNGRDKQVMHSESNDTQGETGNGRVDVTSPNLNFVDNVVNRIFGDHGDCTDQMHTSAPTYEWGSLVLSPCKRRIEVDPFALSADQLSIESTQISFVSDDCSEVESDVYLQIRLSPPPGFDSAGPYNRKNSDPSILTEHETEVQQGSPSTCQCSLVQRVTRAPLKFSPNYVKAWRSSLECRMKRKLAKAILKSLHSNDDEAKRLFGVLPYVSIAAKLNSNVWAEKSSGRSKKIMFTPHFAIDSLSMRFSTEDMKLICEQHVHQLIHSEARKINAIFIPILQERIWWAVAFSFNRREIRVMDPSGLMSQGISQALEILKSSLVVLLHHVFPSWNLPEFSTWNVVFSEFNQKSDELGSGVAMLMAFKSCEDRFNSTLVGSLDVNQRAWLVCEDVMNHHNTEREKCKALLRGVPVEDLSGRVLES